MNKLILTAIVSLSLVLSAWSAPIPTDMWTNVNSDEDWDFDSLGDINRSKNYKISHLRYKLEMNKPYRIEYIIQVFDTGSTDGRGALIRWDDVNEIFFTFADDFPFGIVRETVGGGWSYWAASKEINIYKNRHYHVIIEVLSDKVTMQVDGKKISKDVETPFPHLLELKDQRGGTSFKNIMLKRPRGKK